MKIAKLLTWHWGSLEDREWPFADAVLLTGESGSGKSTLLDAIQTVLTAAHQHVVQFNIGQDESTQSRRGGKEPRTLAAYALGQQADGVYLRTRSTSYAGIVFEASEHAGEQVEPFTALVGVEAFEDGRRAVLQGTPQFFIVRRTLSLDHLARRVGEALAPSPLPLKELYVQLQHRLQAHAEKAVAVVQRFPDKGGYLQHLYGALTGKTAVGEHDATRAAKSLVKAMAYKELGNVNDLVRDEILEPHDFSKDLDKMRELMRSIASLKLEAERLALNLERLGAASASADQALDEARRFVTTTIAHALRTRSEAQDELASVQRQIAAQGRKQAQLQEKLASLGAQEDQLREQLRVVDKRLDDSDVAGEKQALENQIRLHSDQFRLHWGRVQEVVRGISAMATQLEQLMALDLSVVPALAVAVEVLRPAALRILQSWPAMADAYGRSATLDVVLPAFELEAFDAQLAALRQGIHDDDASVQGAVLQALTDVNMQLNQLKDDIEQCDAELRRLQSGRVQGPKDAHDAVALIEREIPSAHPHLLAQLVEPSPGTRWQNAIEGYMGGDRFAIIVEAGMEAQCARLVKQHYRIRSPKVVQGRKAMEDTEGRQLEARSVLHELICQHSVAYAFLLAQYGRVRKVNTEEELARTPQGLMEEGLGSRGYGMFACRAPDGELAFGEAARQRRRQWCEDELKRLASQTRVLDALRQSLLAITRMFNGAVFSPLTPLVLAVLESQVQHAHADQALKALDLSAIDALLAEQSELKARISGVTRQRDEELKQVGATDKEIAELRRREKVLIERLPDLEIACTNATVWASRFVGAVPALATEAQLLEESWKLAGELEISVDALRHRVQSLRDGLPRTLRELAQAVGVYLSGARDDSERVVWVDAPRSVDRLEELLPLVERTRAAIFEQTQRQRAIGLADNARALREAEGQFNHVFTSSFCFKVRDDVKQGALTLQRLNRHLQDIRFGSDTFRLEWDWVPRMQKVQEFFEAVEGAVEGLEHDGGSIFNSSMLTDEQHATAKEIRGLLLANDQGASERALRELADYRNYRRYDILRTSPVGTTRLSTWGTGSGGELETPFYVVRSAVLAHALGHFGRDRREAPALRLMLSDEAFSKMDETRSRNVLQFLSQTLGLQLVVAMPTSKSGAVKPEFDKEFTFSKVMARRAGEGLQELFISEAQEKTFNRPALARLWGTHAEQAREAARAHWQAAKLVAQVPQPTMPLASPSMELQVPDPVAEESEAHQANSGPRP
ncbi:ArsR family transcriptional regulator [Xanthomonas citri pv. glycines str. 8ra]|uniref:SbcC/MukB-like Walker B domain-containing protein n=1 Tax=Xanthomonas TaxID=338 RepID=UPI00044B1B41|nr:MULTISPECIES: SbcC/MukB-like Walker B domain-containing protein [Xanthomonas]AOY62484.1 ArsR family transcriptional regulator [Xanthomonas citri pv. glycines str. 8ra]EWC52063.1 ArsR family transcriptional regulator [Xanthomonas citri pv. glycines str. 8ra]QDR45889.1 ArsR family transcriptional regulator [Xanthomonas citri pv. glycines]